MIVTGTLVAALALFTTNALPLGVTGIGIIAVLGLSGVLEGRAALAAFASPAVVLVGSLYVVSASLIRTGVVGALEQQLVRWSKDSKPRVLFVTTVATALASSLLNNTSVVVLMLPILLAAAARLDIAPSKLLIPLSYASILGGTMTLIGTSTNVLVKELASQSFTIHFLDFLPMGLTFCGVGLTYLWFVAPHLLPARATVSSITKGKTFEFVSELRVPKQGPAVGIPVSSLAARAGKKIRVLRLLRGEEAIQQCEDEILQPDDVIDLRGPPEVIVALRRDLGLEARYYDSAPTGTTFAEAVVTPGSVLLGRTLGQIALNRTAGVIALALQRRGAHLRQGYLNLPLETGDVILVQGRPEDVARLRTRQGLILLVGVDEHVALRRRAPVAIGILATFVLCAALTSFSLPLLAVAAAGLCLATRCLSLDRATREIDWNILGLLAGAITLGSALHITKLDGHVARAVIGITRDLGPYAVLGGVYLLTSILTEFVSNSGAAALMVPIAIATSGELSLRPEPFVFAVAFAASASFATPIGYQTNAFILGPGGYTFGDYVRVGLPLQLLLAAYATVALPFFFPFA